GQAAVVSGRRVVAVEDVGGTDELLARVGRYRDAGLVGDGSSPLVLAKASKPQQPAFVDLPAIGPRTVENAATAGVRLIVIEAGRALLLERAALFAAAEAQAVGLYALAP
ncbi:MAG TPA: UDP-2,3-diacylglucosamine diphosphatase LpxI, partial [Alphaproteobacteria bacterium]|nr:UDP-2,3-diacylglucosamine diphosphatase LpxI [Alphaproteobacteria bacterium]